MKKRILALALVALSAFFCAGCAKPAPGAAPALLATTQPVYQMASALIEGTPLTAELLISEPVSCLHEYTLSVTQMKKIESAERILLSGRGLEAFMRSALAGHTNLFSVMPETGDEEADAHWWLNPEEYDLAAVRLCSFLSEAYPAYKAQLEENLEALSERLLALTAYGNQTLQELSCRELVTFHDGFSSFADAFGLTVAAAMEVESGSEPSAKELAGIVELVRTRGIPAVFSEANGDTAAAQTVARETGCKLASLDLAVSNPDYFAAMRQNIDTVKEALG